MKKLLLLLVLAGCYRKGRPPHGPSAATALEAINSTYDDFNAADPALRERRVLVFSTNRGSQGHDFDLYQSQFEWNTEGGSSFTATEPVAFAPDLMSDADERGPNFINYDDWDPTVKYASSASWMALTSNRSGGAGGLDLYASGCGNMDYYGRSAPCESGGTLVPLESLNTPGDDAYLSTPFAPRSLLFASNRDGGTLHIYAAHWAEKAVPLDPVQSIAAVPELAGDGEDTAPFVYRMKSNWAAEVVFTSTRSGGAGEHDLYCSRFDGKKWSAPKNLGAKVNSPQDEYRPIVFEVSSTRFLIFSSTRPGGKGGYDLYYLEYKGCPH